MEIIFFGIWGAILAFALCVLMLVVKVSIALARRASGSPKSTSFKPWLIAVAATGVALLFAFMMASGFSRGFWK